MALVGVIPKEGWNFFFFFLKSVSYQKKGGSGPSARPSFGMTTTQDIRDLFAKRSPYTK